MSLHDYRIGADLYAKHLPFYALIQAAMRRADSENVSKLKVAFPEVWAELYARYHAPGGCITDEERAALMEEIEVDRRCRERGGDSTMADEKDPGEDKAGDEQTEQPPKEGEEKKDEGQAP
jgi:hypothetical protein